MKRRQFLRSGALTSLGATLLPNLSVFPSKNNNDHHHVKNIIFMVSDGMSIGTLSMANMLAQIKYQKLSNWIDLYNHPNTSRALMDTASESSLVTDSAAASSAWGGGKRVPNGSLNINTDGSSNTPILQKFKQAGKSVGCITTVPITHATPAGFCVAVDKRNEQEYIAELYTALNFDIFLGGGAKYVLKELRSDKKDVAAIFREKGYAVVSNKKSLLQSSASKLVGIFAEDALPYTIDQINDKELAETTPSLAEMLTKGLSILEKNTNGFVVQVEAGKVDWAAHANDVGALLYDQLAFDEALSVAKQYVDKHPNTLLIVTTDHGNANPGLFYGKQANSNFKKILEFKSSNEKILNSILPSDTIHLVKEKIKQGLNITITDGEASTILNYYSNLSEQGVYNYKKLPYKYLGALLKNYTSVGFGDMDHSGDLVELTMYGKNSSILPPMILNFEIHNLLLKATGLL